MPEDVDALLATNVDRLPKVLETVEDPETVREAFHADDRKGAIDAYQRWANLKGFQLSDYDRVVQAFIDVCGEGSLSGKENFDGKGENSAMLTGRLDGALYDFHLVPAETDA